MLEWFLFNNLTYLVHLILIIGLIGSILATIAKRFSYIAKFVAPLFFILFLVGVYLEGNLNGKKDYINAVNSLNKKIEEAESKSAKVNEVIKTVYVDRVKIIKEKSEDNVKYVEKIVTKYDNLCTLSNAAIKLHDSASQNVVAQSSGGTDEGTSNVKISELLRTVTENYATYYQTREQVIGWQQWYNEQKKIFESIK
jgi:heterodisulfide reductase subunit B